MKVAAHGVFQRRARRCGGQVGGDDRLWREAGVAHVHAVAAAGRNGQVHIAAERTAADSVRIEVRDDGPGIAPELREKIFAPFFTTREKGTGLGLAFVREIVREHGGDVIVSDAPDGGSVFAFELPRADREQTT